VSGEPFDLSVVVTAHDEAELARPTMRAGEDSCRAAEAAGFRLERMIAFDHPTAECRAFFTQPEFDAWRKVDVDGGDLGRTRNAVLGELRGRWVAFLDADDLFSENWLAEGARVLAAAERAGERVVVHPEFNWIFEGGEWFFARPAQDDPVFSPYFFYFATYYDSLCMAPRAAHLEIPYVHRDIPNGLSFQDWQWSIETMAAGWRHAVARDAIIFKRRRVSSLVTESRNANAIIRSIEPMAIDRIERLGKGRTDAAAPPVPTAVEEPAVAPRSDRRQLAAWAARLRLGAIRDYRRLRDGSLFDAAYYARRYPDVRRSGMSPLAHFVAHGAWEGRRPNALFDTEAYLERYPALARSRRRNPLVHWLEQKAA